MSRPIGSGGGNKSSKVPGAVLLEPENMALDTRVIRGIPDKSRDRTGSGRTVVEVEVNSGGIFCQVEVVRFERAPFMIPELRQESLCERTYDIGSRTQNNAVVAVAVGLSSVFGIVLLPELVPVRIIPSEADEEQSCTGGRM